jgi:energy-coupling factor transport system permease protein
MTLSVHVAAIDTGRLARANPLAKIGACFILGIAAALTNDPVTPAFLLTGAVLALGLGGIRLRALLRRGWPVLLSAAGLGVTTLIFGDSDQPWMTALSVTVRVLAIALPGIAVLMTINPTDLADSLVQHAKAPAKFAYAALAALRLLPLLALEWQTISHARRARGVDAGRNPIARARLFGSIAFTLLVGAVRRGTRLATAMDARGFDSTGPRTIARPQVIRRSDAALVLGTVALIGIAVVASVLLGTFRPLWG